MISGTKKRMGGVKISPEVVEKRLKQGVELAEKRKKSMAAYKETAGWMGLDEKEAYKYFIAGNTFGGEYTKIFHLPHLFNTNWAIILQCSGQGRDLQTRHSVMAMVHYSMFLTDRQLPMSNYAIPNDLPYVKAVLKLSDEEVRTLFVQMMNERNIPLNEDEQVFLSIDPEPLFATIERWAGYYKEKERYSNGNRGSSLQAAVEALYAGSGDLSFGPTPLEEEACIQSIMSNSRIEENYDMLDVTPEVNHNGHTTDLVIDIQQAPIQAMLRYELDKFLATYIPPSGQEFELLRDLNTSLTTKKLEQDAMIVQLMEENEDLRAQLALKTSTISDIERMITQNLEAARSIVKERQ